MGPASDYTTWLFPTPTALRGAGQVIDLWPRHQHYNISPTPEDADLAALARDWAAVGEDLHQAIRRFEVTVYH